MINWHLETHLVKSLKTHPKNPRQISKDQMAHLEANIRKFGIIDKPVVTQDMRMIGGHQRLKVLKKMKIKSVECWVPDRELSDEEIDELLIKLNLHQGSYDYDILANEWEPLDLIEWGFSQEKLMGSIEIDSDSSEEKKEKKKKSCPSCGHEF